jgi:hypothetical protein
MTTYNTSLRKGTVARIMRDAGYQKPQVSSDSPGIVYVHVADRYRKTIIALMKSHGLTATHLITIDNDCTIFVCNADRVVE